MIATIETSGLTFDAETHTYRFEGREVPSVTQVLEDNRVRTDFSKVSFHTLEHARQRGQAVHLATHYHDDGTLDESTLDAEIVPYLDAWKRFKDERRVRIIKLEQLYGHRELRYGGMLDRVALVETMRREQTVVIDIKSGDTEGADLQLAAYVGLFKDATGCATPLVERWAVQLRPDSPVPYVVIPYRSARDWGEFKTLLGATWIRSERGVHWRTA